LEVFVVCAVLLFGAVGAVGLGASEGRRRRNDGVEAWRRAASALGAEAGRTPHHGLRAVVGAVEVHAQVIDHIGALARQTRVWARARVRPQPRLALGTRRRRLESIALDPATMAWTDRPRHVAARWTAGDGARWRRVQEGASADTCRLVSDGDTVELVIGAVVTDTDRLIAAIELVGRIANDDMGATAALADLPAATPVPGKLAVRLAPDDVVVEVDPHTSSTVIRGTAEIGAARVRVRSIEELERVRARWATPDVVAAFAGSGAATLEISLGESRLAWLKLELGAERLRAGIATIRRIGGGASAEPYR
jgi:hypothetical protein